MISSHRQNELLERASQLRTCIVAPRTKLCYRTGYNKFLAFLREMEYHGDPNDLKPGDAQIFIPWLQDQKLTFFTIRSYVSGVKYYFSQNDWTNIWDTKEVKETLRGLEREIGHLTEHRRLPIEPEQVRRLVAQFDTEQLPAMMYRAFFLVMYAGMFRCSDMLHMVAENVIRINDGVKIIIAKSKTDQVATGDSVILKCLGDTEVCPVTALFHYMDSCGITAGPLFILGDELGKEPENRRSVSYASVTRQLHAALETTGIPCIEKLGTHSFRIGAATAAARNGVPERVIQRHGRWLSDRVRLYIRESIEEISVASQNIF